VKEGSEGGAARLSGALEGVGSGIVRGGRCRVYG